MKRFNTQRGLQVSQFLVQNPEATIINNTRDELSTKLDTISNQIQRLSDKIGQTTATETSSLPATTEPRTVALYYFNEVEDSALPVEQQINTSSIQPVQRTIRSSENIIADTIKVLIQGNLTENEQDQWFVTEFPHPSFALLDTQLDDMGTLTLTFNEVPWFTSGWSARMLILSKSIEKTALQFPEVTRVIFEPETLFQP
jgi:spore germination protein GerM